MTSFEHTLPPLISFFFLLDGRNVSLERLDSYIKEPARS
jgi:hypothetical protein